MSVVSAAPDDLDGYVTAAHGVADRLALVAGRLTDALADFERTCDQTHLRVGLPDVGAASQEISVALRALAGDVAGTATAFREADTGSVSDVVHADAAAVGRFVQPPVPVAAMGDLRAAGSPADVAAVWESVDAGTREALIDQAPLLVGNTDGIPFPARYAANRNLVAGDLRREQAKPSPDGDVVKRLETLAGMQVVVYQPDLGRLATVRGDVGTARFVAVFVPGTGSTVDRFLTGASGTDNKGANIFVTADDLAPDAVAVVSWLGYDAPPEIPDAGFPDRAERGGGLLTSFTGSMRLRDDQTLTLIGHSYGSTVVGEAVGDGAPATDVVVVGSPGMGVESADDLALPPGGRVYAGRAPGDPVSNLESFGQDPSMPSFGGVRIATNDPADPLVPVIKGHSSYFELGTMSLANITRVVIGDDVAVQEASIGDRVADRPRLRGLAGWALGETAERHDGRGSGVIGGVDRVRRTTSGLVQAGERNLVDSGAALADETAEGVGDLARGTADEIDEVVDDVVDATRVIGDLFDPTAPTPGSRWRNP